MKENNEFWTTCGRIINKEATEEELVSFQALLSDNPELCDKFDRIRVAFTRETVYNELREIDIITGWKKVDRLISKRSRPNLNAKRADSIQVLFRKRLKYAAVVLSLVSISLLSVYLVRNLGGVNSHISRVEAPLGSKSKVSLPDGTVVWLNAGTYIEYSNRFGKSHRTLSMTGEAFFEVEEGTTPFIISLEGITIRVLGTSFNVKAYQDEDYIETTLISGSLVLEGDIDTAPAQAGVTLKPNQKATYYKPKKELLVSDRNESRSDVETAEDKVTRKIEVVADRESTVDIDLFEKEIGWKNDIILVENETLEQLSKRLGRIYGVTFEFRDEITKNYRYSGRLMELELDQVLNAIKLTSPIDYEMVDRVVIINDDQLKKKEYSQITKIKNEKP